MGFLDNILGNNTNNLDKAYQQALEKDKKAKAEKEAQAQEIAKIQNQKILSDLKAIKNQYDNYDYGNISLEDAKKYKAISSQLNKAIVYTSNSIYDYGDQTHAGSRIANLLSQKTASGKTISDEIVNFHNGNTKQNVPEVKQKAQTIPNNKPNISGSKGLNAYRNSKAQGTVQTGEVSTDNQTTNEEPKETKPESVILDHQVLGDFEKKNDMRIEDIPRRYGEEVFNELKAMDHERRKNAINIMNLTDAINDKNPNLNLNYKDFISNVPIDKETANETNPTGLNSRDGLYNQLLKIGLENGVTQEQANKEYKVGGMKEQGVLNAEQQGVNNKNYTAAGTSLNLDNKHVDIGREAVLQKIAKEGKKAGINTEISDKEQDYINQFKEKQLLQKATKEVESYIIKYNDARTPEARKAVKAELENFVNTELKNPMNDKTSKGGTYYDIYQKYKDVFDKQAAKMVKGNSESHSRFAEVDYDKIVKDANKPDETVQNIIQPSSGIKDQTKDIDFTKYKGSGALYVGQVSENGGVAGGDKSVENIQTDGGTSRLKMVYDPEEQVLSEQQQAAKNNEEAGIGLVNTNPEGSGKALQQKEGKYINKGKIGSNDNLFNKL